MAGLSISPLPSQKISEAAAVIALAFREKPISRYQLDLSDTQVLFRFALAIEAVLQVFHHAGQPLLAALDERKGITGVAMVRASPIQLSSVEMLRILLPRLPALLPLLPRYNLRSLALTPASKEPSFLPKPFFSLDILAVHPGNHSQGVGRRLLEHVGDLCSQDENCQGIYLLTGATRTRNYYLRHGYHVVRACPAGPLQLYHMFRYRK